MNCQEAQQWRHASQDGELDLSTSVEMERHVSECAACAKATKDIAALRSLLRSTAPAYKAPEDLWERVRPATISMTERKEPVNRRLMRPWLNWAFPTAIAAAAVLLAFVTVSNNSARRQLVREVASSHVRSLQPGHLMDVASTDSHTVKPWFDGKLDFAPPVVNSATNGFPLVGGRLDYLAERPVAALVYQRGNHLINVFIWPIADEPATDEKSFVERGYNILHWSAAGMNYWAVSDLNRLELREFERLLHPAPAAPVTP
jgi:anti-sigma factor RsiW